MAKVNLKRLNGLRIPCWRKKKKSRFSEVGVCCCWKTQPETKGLDNATIAIFRCHIADHTNIQAPGNKNNSTDQLNHHEVRMQLFSDRYRRRLRHGFSITLNQVSLTSKDSGPINQFFLLLLGHTINKHPLLFLWRRVEIKTHLHRCSSMSRLLLTCPPAASSCSPGSGSNKSLLPGVSPSCCQTRLYRTEGKQINEPKTVKG